MCMYRGRVAVASAHSAISYIHLVLSQEAAANRSTERKGTHTVTMTFACVGCEADVWSGAVRC